MKRLLFILLAGLLTLPVAAQFQPQNGGFEDWESVSDKGEEPLHWSSFLTASGSFASIVANVQLVKATEVRPGSTGQLSAKITSSSTFGVIAQGNLTSGCINAGSMSATDASGNYNFTNEEDEGQCMIITGRPDAVRVWVNLYTGNANYPTGNVSVYLHEKGYYQDPNTANRDKLVGAIAHAHQTPQTGSSSTYTEEGWQQLTIPFEYSSTSRPYYMLATFSTNSTPGSGTENDWMYIDDMELLYYSELASASYAGEDIRFTNGKAQVDADYNEKLLKVVSTGAGAKIERELNPETFLLTITIKGDNISEDPTNVHTYQIQFTGVASGADDEANVTVVPGTVTLESSAKLTDGGSYYLYNVAQKGYLNNNDKLSDDAKVLWTISTSNGTITDAEGHYVIIDRTTDAKDELKYDNFPVTSSQTEYGDKKFTFYEGDGYINFYRKDLKYYKGGFLGFGSKTADIYVGAASKDQLYACDANNNIGKWQILTKEDFDRYNAKNTFWANYDKASLQNGVDATAFIKSNVAHTLEGMPLGIYEFGQTGKFYLPYNEAIDVTAEQSQMTLTYYGRLNFSLNATYDGQAVENNQVDAIYDDTKLLVTLGNGAESYLSDFDEETCKLSITISGYGRSKEHEIQFVVPALTLQAFWYGEELTNGATVDEEYNEVGLKLVPGRGTAIEKNYNAETGLLTVVVTSVYGKSQEFTFQFKVYGEVKSTETYDVAEEISQYCNGQLFEGNKATVSLEVMKADGKINFILNNFTTLDSEGNELVLGNLAVKGLERLKNGKGPINFTGEVHTQDGRTVSITIDGNKPSKTVLEAAVTVLYDNVLTQYFYGIYPVKTTTFNGKVSVTINGSKAGETKSDIAVDELNNGHINFSLTDFEIPGDIGKVGTITLLNLPFTATEGSFSYSGNLYIAPGTVGEVSEWMGPNLGSIPVSVEGTMLNGLLTFFINIDFREQLGQIISVNYTGTATGIAGIKAQQQGTGEIYDLTGRRISGTAKGLYIINGRKVLK